MVKFSLIHLEEPTLYTKENGTEMKFNPITDAQILQWSQFTNSEIIPFLHGLVTNLGQHQTR